MDTRRLIKVLRRSMSPYKMSVYHLLRERAIVASAEYAEQHLKDAMIFDAPQKLWTYAASRARDNEGLILEFGVFRGRSINHFALQFKEDTLHGFDSFEGLAEDWVGYHLPKGSFDLAGQLPKVAPNVELYKGWFDQVLPQFLEENEGPIKLCHVDCDTFESARYVLDTLSDRLIPGSIIVFDEYYGYPNWMAGEYKAWQDVCTEKAITYKYIALADMQVAVEIT